MGPDDVELPGEPFWDVVQRRHPDATIVLLPPEQPIVEPPAPELASPADADRAAREVDDLFTDVWQLVLPGHEVADSPVRWEVGSASGLGVAVRSGRVDGLDPDEAHRLVDAADAALTARAWRVTPPAGALHRVVATTDDSTVTVSSHRDVCRVQVQGPELAVGRTGLRRLREADGA